MSQIACPSCAKEISSEAPTCPQCGHPVKADDGGAITTLIPYKNSQALAAYYLAVFSLIPCIGGVLGMLAVIFGILGLKAVKRNPKVKGTAHAYVGLILGGIVLLAHLVFGVWLIIAAAQQ